LTNVERLSARYMPSTDIIISQRNRTEEIKPIKVTKSKKNGCVITKADMTYTCIVGFKQQITKINSCSFDTAHSACLFVFEFNNISLF